MPTLPAIPFRSRRQARPGRQRVIWWVDGLWSAGAGVVAVVAAWWALRLNVGELAQRWQVGGDDGLLHNFIFAAATRGFSYSDVSAVGFPRGLNVFFSGQVDPSSAIVVAILAVIFHRATLMLSVFVLLGFFSSAVTGTWFGRSLRLRRPTSAAVGIVFALAPFHFIRISYGHYFLANTWAIPLIGICVLMVLGGSLDPFGPWRRSVSGRRRAVRTIVPAVLLGLGIASTASYYAFFGAVVLAGAWLIRCVSRIDDGRIVSRTTPGRRVRVRLPATTVTAVIVSGMVLVSIVVSGLGFGVRARPYFAARLPGESELYAGKLVSLLLPWQGSDVPGTARILAKARGESFILATTEAPGMPVLGLLGLLVLLAAMAAAAGASRRRRAVQGGPTLLGDRRLRALGPVVVWTFLFYTVSGLGFVFALIVGPEIRAWSRLSIVLILFGVGAMGILFDRLPHRVWLRVSVAVAVAALVAVDQLAGVSRVVVLNPTRDLALARFVASADKELPAGCGVVQLPLKTFPDSGDINRMGDYDEALPFVANPRTDLRWSYGSIPGTTGWDDEWARADQAGTPAAFARAIVETRACAVEVDTFAYTHATQSSWLADVTAVSPTRTPILVSAGGRWRLFAIDPHGGVHRPKDHAPRGVEPS